jgi:CHAT domain-containing protein
MGRTLFQNLMPLSIWNEIQGDDRVYVVPDAAMSGLPLEALVVSNSGTEPVYWLDGGPPIAYGPSAGVLVDRAAIRSTEIHAKGSFLHQAILLGDPILHPGQDLSPTPVATTQPQLASAAMVVHDRSLSDFGNLSDLPGTKTEIEAIFKIFTGEEYNGQSDSRAVVLLGKDATVSKLMDAVQGARCIHLATHGLVESGDQAMYSSVVLSQPQVVTPQDTGLITLQDLFDHWWGKLSGTELVVLSACDSQGLDENRANAIGSEGVFGLPWGFMYAGTPAVIASTWEVQDNSTAELMKQFYAKLHDSPDADKLKPFVKARQELKKEYPQPFYWAPFIYLGDPR